MTSCDRRNHAPSGPRALARRVLRKLRQHIPARIRKKISAWGLFFGYDVKYFPCMELTLRYLRDWGFRPARVVDVGAFKGEWTRMTKASFPDTRILMVEPLENKTALLERVCEEFSPSVTYVNALLGPRDGADVTFCEMESGSSVLEEQSPYVRQKAVRETRTLDSVVEESTRWTGLDLLKLDVQGYELHVLDGASRILRDTQFVLMEASLIPTNRGCPLIADVFEYMGRRNFRLLDFCSQNRRKDHALWQTDLLFVKEGSRFLPQPELCEENWCFSA